MPPIRSPATTRSQFPGAGRAGPGRHAAEQRHAQDIGMGGLLAVPTMIAGIYGMNFEFMPGLNWHWGYPTVLTFW